MTRIDNILTRARDTLADPFKERFSDERLLRLIDDAQKYLVLKAQSIRSKTTVPIIPGVSTYTLPDDVAPDGISAKLENGVLDVTFAKQTESEDAIRKIEIN